MRRQALLFVDCGGCGLAAQIRRVVRFVDVIAVLMVVGQTLADEVLALVTDGRLLRKHNLTSVEDCLVAHNRHLALVLAKRLHTEE